MDKTKILIVDDEVIIAMSMKNHLEDMGYQVVGIAATGIEAIEIALDKKPDVILMDIMIKGDMDGIETAQKISSYIPDTQIIYTTGHFDEDLLKRAILTEPHGYILKPLKNEEVIANIQLAVYKKNLKEKNSNGKHNLTAIIPAYNEQVSIGSMVLRTKKYVDHVIVVDDGSTDNTSEIAELAGAELIKHETNMGKGKALETGFKAVNNAEIILTLDGDGQHKAEEIPKVLKPIIDGEADIVNGSRYLNGNEENTPAYRRIGQSVLDIATNFNAQSNITDSQSGFRAFAKYTIPAFKFRESGYGIESEMISEASNAGFKIKEVEIGVRYDVDGSNQNPITHGFGVLIRVLQDIEYNRPLYYFTIPGIIMIAVGLISGLLFFSSYLGGESHSLAPTTLAALLTIAGAFIGFTGIILHSISRMIERTQY
jgi:glycosyltransferase involved in cell wall biosynthesis/AmiR/NasT family two-component response regulator